MSEKAGDWIRMVGEGGEPAGSTFVRNMNVWIFVKHLEQCPAHSKCLLSEALC